jgi:hypothetical protein
MVLSYDSYMETVNKVQIDEANMDKNRHYTATNRRVGKKQTRIKS